MKDLKKKMKRVEPIKKVKEIRLNEETKILSDIRQEKQQVLSKLKENQRLYLEGLKTLNDERRSGITSKLQILESSLDHVKDRWFDCLKDLRKVEEKERLQVVQVIVAQKDIKTLDKLSEKYQEQADAMEKKQEQNRLDELAIVKHSAS